MDSLLCCFEEFQGSTSRDGSDTVCRDMSSLKGQAGQASVGAQIVDIRNLLSDSIALGFYMIGCYVQVKHVQCHNNSSERV